MKTLALFLALAASLVAITPRRPQPQSLIEPMPYWEPGPAFTALAPIGGWTVPERADYARFAGQLWDRMSVEERASILAALQRVLWPLQLVPDSQLLPDARAALRALRQGQGRAFGSALARLITQYPDTCEQDARATMNKLQRLELPPAAEWVVDILYSALIGLGPVYLGALPDEEGK